MRVALIVQLSSIKRNNISVLANSECFNCIIFVIFVIKLNDTCSSLHLLQALLFIVIYSDANLNIEK